MVWYGRTLCYDIVCMVRNLVHFQSHVFDMTCSRKNKQKTEKKQKKQKNHRNSQNMLWHLQKLHLNIFIFITVFLFIY